MVTKITILNQALKILSRIVHFVNKSEEKINKFTIINFFS